MSQFLAGGGDGKKGGGLPLQSNREQENRIPRCWGRACDEAKELGVRGFNGVRWVHRELGGRRWAGSVVTKALREGGFGTLSEGEFLDVVSEGTAGNLPRSLGRKEVLFSCLLLLGKFCQLRELRLLLNCGLRLFACTGHGSPRV